jgi:DNA-binding beta-propeller fold protein YncE
MRSATAALKENNLQVYREALQKVVALRPDYPGGIYALAQAYAREGNTQSALEQLEVLTKMSVEFAPANDSLFAAFANQNRFRVLLERERSNLKPLNRAVASDSFNIDLFHPDGVTYDSSRRRFCIGSVRLRKVSCKDQDGTIAHYGSKAGLWSVLGVAVAPNGHFWLATAALPETPGVSAELRGKTALVEIDPASDVVVQRIEPPNDSLQHGFGDVGVAPDGTVFVSDAAGTLYRVRAGQLEAVGAVRSWVSPQGITFGPDGKQLFVADYSRGVFRVDPVTGAATQLAAPRNTTLLGIDGLAYHRGSLIAIQNGIRPYRVVKLRLDAARTHIRSVELLESNHPLFDEPTTGVVVGDRYYFIANSHWPSFANGATPASKLSAPLLLMLPLR